MTISKVLLSVVLLLADANPEDPLEPEVAKLYLSSRSKHDDSAREWTRRYALDPAVALVPLTEVPRSAPPQSSSNPPVATPDFHVVVDQ